MIELALGLVVLIVGTILAALFIAIAGAWAITAGGLVVSAFLQLLPARQIKDHTP